MSDRNRFADHYDPLKAGSVDGTDLEPHDHGIIRAINAKYVPDLNLKSEEGNTLFVGRIARTVDEEEIREHFRKWGKIKSFRFVRDVVTGFPRGYAFVEYMDKSSARLAYREGNSQTLDGKEIIVEFEAERKMVGWIPRRLGGGLGGRKESGQLRFGGRDRPFRQAFALIKQRGTESVKDVSGFRDRSPRQFSRRSRVSEVDRGGRRSRSLSEDQDRGTESNRSHHRSRISDIRRMSRSKSGSRSKERKSESSRNHKGISRGRHSSRGRDEDSRRKKRERSYTPTDKERKKIEKHRDRSKERRKTKQKHESVTSSDKTEIRKDRSETPSPRRLTLGSDDLRQSREDSAVNSRIRHRTPSSDSSARHHKRKKKKKKDEKRRRKETEFQED